MSIVQYYFLSKKQTFKKLFSLEFDLFLLEYAFCPQFSGDNIFSSEKLFVTIALEDRIIPNYVICHLL